MRLFNLFKQALYIILLIVFDLDKYFVILMIPAHVRKSGLDVT